MSKVENDTINLCYITNYSSFKKYKDITAFQEQVVFKNQYLKQLFKESKPVFDPPLTISQISFKIKKPVENHILMCGDAAGMIHPLCGNGMSMAIQSAQIASSLILQYFNGEIVSRKQLEKHYLRQWNRRFRTRLRAGHFIAALFNRSQVAEIVMLMIKKAPFLLPTIIKQTHGKPMKV